MPGVIGCTVSVLFLLGTVIPAVEEGNIPIGEIPIAEGNVYTIEPDVRLYTYGYVGAFIPVSAGIGYRIEGPNQQPLVAYVDRDELRTGIANLDVAVSQTHLSVFFAGTLPFGGTSAPRFDGHDVHHTGIATFLAFPPSSTMTVYAVKKKGTELVVRGGSSVKVTACPRGYGP